MGNQKKKGTSGQVKNYVTRSQAIRRLQISLVDFRRLCIFKGIYPREPRNRKKANKSSHASTTFYYTRDIQYLLHEPLLNKFREHKILAKKIGRALGRGEVGDAARLERNHKPRITLEHIVKERYPTFTDAVRDLDDALSTLFLFANLPSTSAVPSKTIALCQRLCHEFEHYVIVSHSLRKSFLSVKGIYYQASIQGQDILWLVPYRFVQQMTEDVDFRIMGTFVEFYTTLLGFVNYRLYSTIGLVYPPKFDAKADEEGAELAAYRLEGQSVGQGQQEQIPNGDSQSQQITNGAEDAKATETAQAAANAIEGETVDPEMGVANGVADPEDEEPQTAVDTFQSTDASADSLIQPSDGTNIAATLFSPFVFYLSRETPRAPLEFLVRSFGCRKVGWDVVSGSGAFTADEKDQRITHQVVDRPPPSVDTENGDAAQSPAATHGRIPGRVYVQPQWIWDCANAGKLLPTDKYAPGATLPPHLSPFVKPKRGEYDPTQPLEPQTEAERLLETIDDEDEKNENVVDGVDSVKDIGDLNGEELDEDDELDSEDAGSEAEDAMEQDDDDEELEADQDWTGFSSDDDDASKEVKQHQQELEAEAVGGRAPQGNGKGNALKRAQQQKSKKQREEDESIERRKMMLPRRKRKLFEKMQYSNNQTNEEAEKLKAKRRKLERQKQNA